MTLADAFAEICLHADEVAKCFQPGAKVTILVRNPGRSKEPYGADMVVTQDDYAEIQASLAYLQSRPEYHGEPPEAHER